VGIRQWSIRHARKYFPLISKSCLKAKKVYGIIVYVTEKRAQVKALNPSQVLGRTPPECMERLQSPKGWKTEIQSSEDFFLQVSC